MPGHGGQISDVLTPAGPAPGAKIGAFQLIAPLGTRRPARAWRAVERATGIVCVIKIAVAEERERLALEAALLRRVGDAGVPALLADESAGDPPHIVLELIDGVELEQVLAEGLGAADAASLLAAIAATLGRLHAAGFVHGDVQPANVIVGSDGRPVLIDFGSARIAQDEAGARASIVEVTPGYAAPECRRAGERVGPAADLYAIGAIGYRALTGRARSAGAAPLTESAGEAPFALRAVLDWALETLPDARPESAAELEAALLGSAAAGPQTIRARRLPEHPSEASTVSPEAAPHPRALRRRRFAIAALAAAALAPAIWFGVDAWIERTRLDWRVDPAGGGHARTIADALSRAPSGALIRVAPGTYREKLEIRRDVALLGTGDAAARPVIEGGYGSCLTVRAAAVQIVGLGLRNYSKAPCVELAGGELAIEGGEISAQEGAALVARDGAKLSLADTVVASSGASGIVVSAGASAVIVETKLRQARGSAIFARSGAEIRLRDVEVGESGQSGVLLDEGAVATLERVRIAGSGNSGIEVRGGARLTIAGGAVERAGGAGVFVAGGARATLQGLRVAGSRLSGVFAAAGSEIEIAGSEIDGNGEHGLLVMSLASATLRDTRLTGNAGHGIALQPQARFEATGQVLERNREPQLLDERPAEPGRQPAAGR